MWQNYLKVALRNFWKNKAYSSINISGLAIGLAGCLVIFQWVHYEWSYDRFLAGSARVYRVLLTQRYENGRAATADATPSRLAASLKSEFAGITHAVTMGEEEHLLLQVGNHAYREKGAYAGAEFFSVFGFPLAAGNPATALAAPYSVVISRRLTLKYFGHQNVLGRSIQVDNQGVYQISGVFEDVPANSSLQFDFLLSFATLERYAWTKDWNAIGSRTFLRLGEDAQVEKLAAGIKDYLKEKQTEYNSTLSLQPYQEMHLYGQFRDGQPDGGRITYVRGFLLAALFILLIATINFVNLATARAAKRAREVGVRKAAGASRNMLMRQFMTEALLTVGLALCLALLLLQGTLPLVRALTGQAVFFSYRGSTLLLLGGLVVITTLVAGAYPAYFLSSFQPLAVLKGTFKQSSFTGWLRKGLVVFQFSIGSILLASTLVLYLQTRYLSQKQLGFSRENVVYTWIEGELPRHFEAFARELSDSPYIQSVSAATQAPMHINGTVTSTSVEWPGKTTTQKVAFAWWGVSYGLVGTLGLTLKEGRDFSPAFGTDTLHVLLNEEAAKVMGLEHPLHQPITIQRETRYTGKIIGVVKNFHFHSLHTPIQPLILFLDPKPLWGNTLIRIKPGKTREAMAAIGQAHQKYNPAFPFEYQFADQEYHKLYQTELLAGKLAAGFAGLALVVSCLGLLGLVAFLAEQRTKEIGIRKVLGASVGGIVALLTRDLLKPVGIALLTAFPLAWYGLEQWLENFAYKIKIEWWVFALTAASILLVALLTVGFQSIKAALANPVQSLRTE